MSSAILNSKMILESVQMMCTALNKQGFETPYRSTHLWRPCMLWVEESYDNFLWLGRLAEALNRDYRYRYRRDRDHASITGVSSTMASRGGCDGRRVPGGVGRHL